MIPEDDLFLVQSTLRWKSPPGDYFHIPQTDLNGENWLVETLPCAVGLDGHLTQLKGCCHTVLHGS